MGSLGDTMSTPSLSSPGASFDGAGAASLDRDSYAPDPTNSGSISPQQEDKFMRKEQRMKMLWSSFNDRMEKLIQNTGWNKISKQAISDSGIVMWSTARDKTANDILSIGRRLS